MLHHFGGHPPHVKRNGVGTAAAPVAAMAAPLITAPLSRRSASAAGAKLEQLIARLFETIRMTNQW